MKFTFTFSKRVYLLLSFVAALLMCVNSAKAQSYTITGEEIFNSSDWEFDHSRWSKWSPGMYDNYTTDPTETTDVISPKMSISKTGQKITISGYRGGYNVSQLIFYISYDKETWTEVGNKSTELHDTDYPTIGNFSTEFEATGDYYVKIKILGAFIAKFTIDEFDIIYTPEMTVYKDEYNTQATNGQTIDFGLVETAPTYKYYVKNTNKGVLTVNIDATGGYTVEPAIMSLGAGEMEEVTITAPKGDSNGKITITGKDGEEVIGTFEVNYQGDVMDKENKFFEDFVDEYRAVNSTDLPGWDLDLSVTGDKDGYGRLMFYNSTIYEYANNDESKYMITPKLRIKNNADIMYFNAYGRNGSSDTKIIISYSKDKTTWNTIKTFSYSSFTTTKKTYSFNDIPSGDYYIKFEICDVAIDWVYGYKYAPVPATIELDETVTPEGLTTGTQDVNLKYTIKEGKWNTIALPFAVNDLSVFGTDVKAYAFTGYENNEIKFNKVESLEAGKPYVMYVGTAAEANGNFTFEGVEITATEASESAFNGAALKATYAPIAKGSMTETWYGITPDGKIMKAGANASIKGFRAYMTLPENTDASSLKMMFDGDATGIYVIENNTKNNDAIYNINGQRVSNATKGIYIINGKKVIK